MTLRQKQVMKALIGIEACAPFSQRPVGNNDFEKFFIRVGGVALR